MHRAAVLMSEPWNWEDRGTGQQQGESAAAKSSRRQLKKPLQKLPTAAIYYFGVAEIDPAALTGNSLGCLGQEVTSLLQGTGTEAAAAVTNYAGNRGLYSGNNCGYNQKYSRRGSVRIRIFWGLW